MSKPLGAASMKGILPEGTQLNGIYQIDAFLSSGGMGEIYRGHEILTGSPVAIKVIRDELSGDETALAMFRNEATALNRLHHEAIVRYFLFSLDPILMRHYLAMEFVEGQSLSDYLRRGPLSLEDAHALMHRVALGLQAAHNQKLIHRDVTPDNVIIPSGGVAQARIIDFGIARSTRVGDKTVIGGGFAGKFNYVSPEQLGMVNADVGPASDIYSLGLVLAQSLRGRALDMGGSEYEVIEKRRVAPDLSDIDWGMRPLLERMLQPNPADRPKSMAEVAAWRLGAGASEATVFAPAAPGKQGRLLSSTPRRTAETRGASDANRAEKPAPKRRSLILAGAVAIGLAALGGGVYVARHPVPAPQKEIAATEPPQLAPTPPAVDPTLRIRQGIRDFEGGDCFFALPTSVEATAAEIDGFGRAKEKFDALDAAFKKANGFEAQINVREVTPPQCPTLDFVRRFASLSDSVRLEVAKTKLHRLGDLLQGAIDSPLPHVRLLLVDDEGKVHDLSGQMAASGDRHDFAMRLQAQKPSPLLLVAIGANERIPIANPTQAQQAIDFFPPLVREMSDFAQTPTVAMKYIKLE